jgi:hypothetical protein
VHYLTPALFGLRLVFRHGFPGVLLLKVLFMCLSISRLSLVGFIPTVTATDPEGRANVVVLAGRILSS